jgi:DNA-binding cell septation regulator SpoVG
MEEVTVFNLRAVNQGMLKATIRVQLESGLIIHDCKILEQDGTLLAQLPQYSERLKGGRGSIMI